MSKNRGLISKKQVGGESFNDFDDGIPSLLKTHMFETGKNRITILKKL